MKYKIWNGMDSLVTPIGEVFSPEEIRLRIPAAALDGFKWVICDAPKSMGLFEELSQFKEHYRRLGVQFTEEMSDQEILDAITYFEENPPALEPSAEERMAAAFEFQSMMMMPV